MAKTLTYYQFHAEDQTLVMEPLFNMTSVLTEDVDKKHLIGEILRAGLDNQRPEDKTVAEDIVELKNTGGYGRLLDDLTVGYRLTDGENVFEVRTRPGQFLDEYEKEDFSLDRLWRQMIEDAVEKSRTFPVEKKMTEHEYQQAMAYPFRLSLDELQKCPLKVTRTSSYQPIHLDMHSKTHRVDVYTERYNYALLDDDFRMIASVPVTVECIRADDDSELNIRIVHEKDQVQYEGGLLVGEADTLAGFLNMKVAEALQGDEFYMLRRAERETYYFTNQLPLRDVPVADHKITYETVQGLKEEQMPLIEKGLELLAVRNLLVAEAVRKLDKALEDGLETLDRCSLDPRQESPVNALLRGLNVSVTDGEKVYEASIPALKDFMRTDMALLCRHVSDELLVKEPCKVQKILDLNQTQKQDKTETLDMKSFRLR